MFFFACPACASRIAMCHGQKNPVVSRCPECSILLAFVREERTLVEKIRDAWTPLDLIEAINGI